MVNACSNEGSNEYVVFRNTRGLIHVDPDSIVFSYSTKPYPSSSLTDTFLANGNKAFCDSLNSQLDLNCSLEFVNCSVGDTLETSKKVILFYKEPTDTPDLSFWCSSNEEKIYCLFTADPNWRSNGNFANSPSGKRYFRLVLNSDSFNSVYTNQWSASKDGNYVYYDSLGDNPKYGNYPNCEPINLQSLPVHYEYFRGYNSGLVNTLIWSTSSELNNEGFNIWRRTDQEDWEIVDFVSSNYLPIQALRQYKFDDKIEETNAYYYRLEQIDWDGIRTYSDVIKIQREFEAILSVEIYPNPADSYAQLSLVNGDLLKPNSLRVQLVDYKGFRRNIQMDKKMRLDLSSIPSGYYFVVVQMPYNFARIPLYIR